MRSFNASRCGGRLGTRAQTGPPMPFEMQGIQPQTVVSVLTRLIE